MKKKELPYLYKTYNLECYYMNPLSDVNPSIVRIYNAMVKALNMHEHLPKYIIITPNKDIVEDIRNLHFDCGLGDSIEENINWLLKNVAKALLARRNDLKRKRIGSAPLELPRVFWVKMMARPHTTNMELAKTWKLRKKFNEILFAVLSIEKYMDLIPMDKVNEYSHFDQFGNLTSTGQLKFWRALNDHICNFESGKAAAANNDKRLLHHVHQSANPAAGDKGTYTHTAQPYRHRLPTPPGYHHHRTLGSDAHLKGPKNYYKHF